MEKRYFLFRTFVAVILISMSVLALSSCEKEPIIPDTNDTIVPDTNDSVVPDINDTVVPDLYQRIYCEASATFEGFTYTGNVAALMDYSPVVEDQPLKIVAYLSYGTALSVDFDYFETDSIMLHVLNSNPDNIPSVSGVFSEYDSLNMCHSQYSFYDGTVTIVKLGNSQYRIYGQVEVAAFAGIRSVEFSIVGGIYDQDHPIGMGSITYGGYSATLAYVSHTYSAHLHQYVVRGLSPDTYFIINSSSELTHDMPISDDIQDIYDGTHVGVILIHQSHSERFDDGLYRDTLHVARAGNNYTFSFDCNTTHGHASANYEGIVLDI